MQRQKKEACRNFQRGFCQYGERCRFLHQTQPQQPQPQSNNNPFGFGSNNRQQPQQPKPFDNKWSRFSPVSNNPQQHHHHHQQQQQPNSKSQPATTHECTDPESCKRVFAEDFQNERPLWKLTCYGHWKSLPCDISGDISCEELRAAAYDDAKRGLGLPSILIRLQEQYNLTLGGGKEKTKWVIKSWLENQSIGEISSQKRERNLLNSKQLEFENLLRDYRNSGHGTSKSLHAAPGSGPPTVSSFSQLGASLNLGVGLSPATPPMPSTQPNPFSITNQMTTTTGIRPPAPMNNPFSQSSPFPNQGSVSSLIPQQPIVSSPAASFGSVFNSGAGSQPPLSAGLVPNSTLAAGLGQSPHPSAVQVPTGTNGSGLTSVPFGKASPSFQSVSVEKEDDSPVDASVWKKERWTIGEIPEQAPPDMYIY